MKKALLFYCILTLFTSSCAYQYQIFDTSSTEVLDYKDDVYVYESENVDIYYDFWDYGGLMVFNLFNKTNQSIKLELDSCQFLLNDVRLPYGTQNIYGLEEYASLYNWSDELELSIPPGKSIQLEGYPVNFRWHRFNNKKVKYIDYDRDNSPYKFNNRIAFSLESDPNEIFWVDNEFWVSEVKRLKYDEFEKLTISLEGRRSDKFFVNREQNPVDADAWVDVTFAFLDLLTIFF